VGSDEQLNTWPPGLRGKEKEMEMKYIEIDVYHGYRHNAYDSLNSSWGIVMGLGGSANAFTKACWHEGNGRNCDYCDVVRAWNGKRKFDIKSMCMNLDMHRDTLDQLLDVGGTHTEYWGEGYITMFFTPGRVRISGLGKRDRVFLVKPE